MKNNATICKFSITTTINEEALSKIIQSINNGCELCGLNILGPMNIDTIHIHGMDRTNVDLGVNALNASVEVNL